MPTPPSAGSRLPQRRERDDRGHVDHPPFVILNDVGRQPVSDSSGRLITSRFTNTGSSGITLGVSQQRTVPLL